MKAMTLRMPDGMHDYLRRLASERDRSITELILKALDEIKPGTRCDERFCFNAPTHVTTPGGFHFCDEHSNVEGGNK